jgi:uncharacterized protein (DUF427 family)
MKAIWNGVVLAESDETIMVEGNHYFPADSLNSEYFQENSMHTVCPWKGTASYYDIVVDGKANHGGAWTYPKPSSAAKNIEGYVAFWRGVKVKS